MGTKSPAERLAQLNGHKRDQPGVVPNLDEFERARETADGIGLSALSLPDAIKHLHSNAMGGVLEVEEAIKFASEGFADVAPSLREAIERLQRVALDAENRAEAAEVRVSELLRGAIATAPTELAPVVPEPSVIPDPGGEFVDVAPSKPAATLDDLADVLGAVSTAAADEVLADPGPHMPDLPGDDGSAS